MKRESSPLVSEKQYVGKLWNPTTQVGNWDYNRKPIDMVIIHTMDGYMGGTLSWFNKPESKVSAHYLLSVDGKQWIQTAEETKVCYHSGKYDTNQRSIAIEVEDNNNPHAAREEAVYNALAQMVVDQARFYGFPIDRDHVKGHREISSGKSCPAAISVDEVVRLAHIIHEQQVASEKPAKPNIEPVAPIEKPVVVTPVLDNVDTSSVDVLNALSQGMREFRRADGSEYKTMLEFATDLMARVDDYADTLAPDEDGIPPIVVDASEYDSLYAMAMNFEDVADFYELSDSERVSRDAGKQVIQMYIDSRSEVIDLLKDPATVNNIISQDSGLPSPSDSTSNSFNAHSQSLTEKITKVLNSDIFDLFGKFIALFNYGSRSK